MITIILLNSVVVICVASRIPEPSIVTAQNTTIVYRLWAWQYIVGFRIENLESGDIGFVDFKRKQD